MQKAIIIIIIVAVIGIAVIMVFIILMDKNYLHNVAHWIFTTQDSQGEGGHNYFPAAEKTIVQRV